MSKQATAGGAAWTAGIPKRALPAWAELAQALEDTPPSEIPCRSGASGDWTGSDPVAARRAALECLACPAMLACLRYARAAAEPAGIWGSESATTRLARTRSDGRDRATAA